MKKRYVVRALILMIALLAAAEIWLGSQLLLLGGSPYYLMAGLLTLIGAIMFWLGHGMARFAFHLLFGGTLVWSVWETEGEFWGMLSRMGLVTAFWIFALVAMRKSSSTGNGVTKRPAIDAAVAITGLCITGVAAALFVHPGVDAASNGVGRSGQPAEWTSYARTLDAQRHSPLAQITPDNVGRLEIAWTYRTGDLPQDHDAGKSWTFEATPIKVGNSLILCTPHTWIVALDVDSGKRLWQFDPKVDDEAGYIKACRGVAYHKTPDADTAQLCGERIIAGTLDGRLLALDARTGKLCPGFGDNGMISVYQGMDNPGPGFAYITSAPLVIGQVAIVGGWVTDGISTGEPSGAVRAYDVMTGNMVWAWDNGTTHRAPFPANLSFAKGTPNVWAPMSADEELGLIYLSTGNATPDYWGGHRTPELEQFASSIVAVDAATGELRWSFQTVHHDVWDYDVPAAPILFDFKRGGNSVPALAQVTKQGEIFVLDRRDGKPLIPVEERAVPQGPANGDWLSPTQPFSSAPNIRGVELTEAGMWGLTPLDQAACRIKFRSYRYEGIYTPQTTGGTIAYPAPFGATDWGGATFD